MSDFFEKTITSLRYKIKYKICSLVPKFLYPQVLWLYYLWAMKKVPNFKNPVKLTEKIQLLKLYDSTDIKTRLADKIEVKNWVKRKIPELKFAKIYQIGKRFEELDFDKLPDAFLLKTNHASKANMLCLHKDKINTAKKNQIAKQMNKILKDNYAFVNGYELHYKKIEPKIFAEELLMPKTPHLIRECQILCINGKPELILAGMMQFATRKVQLKKDAFWTITPFNLNWERLNFCVNEYIQNNDEIERPKYLEQMISYASSLADGFKLVRVDFLYFEDEFYLSEMTFTPFSGYIKFSDPKLDEILGEKLKI